MIQSHKRKVLILIAIVVGSALFLPAIFGEPREVDDQRGGDSWRNFVYDFQTLITGIMAIGAAYFTIRASQKIDQQQQLRHEKMYDLQVRPDKLRLARSYPRYLAFRQLGRNLMSYEMPAFSEGFEKPNWQSLEEARRISVYCHLMGDELTCVEIGSVHDLFDGELSTCLRGLRTSLKSLEIHASLLSAEEGKMVSIPVSHSAFDTRLMSAQIRENGWHASARDMMYVKTLIQNFESCFEALLLEYKVV